LDLQLKPLYQPDDLADLAHLNSLPGQPPYVRGPYASMYTQRPWTIRQYSGFGSAAQTNQRLKQHLANGVQGLSIAFDLPTHRGYDSDNTQCWADVGMAGVAIDSVEDMHSLFDGIALDQVSVSMTMNGAVLPVMAAFIVAARERNVRPDQLSGTLQNDILKEFMVRNTYIFPPEPSLRVCCDVIEYLAQHMPCFNPVSVSGYHFQEAGADGVLELALTLINARTYMEQVRERDLDVNAFCARMSFFFGVGNDLYGEIAKLRAARLLWCEISEAAGATDASARALRMHCQTSGYTLSAQEPLNNVVRTTIQALSAVFGGTQSLHTNAWDEALALPSESSASLASNTQRILQQETGVCDVIDPWAGSYLMESLTGRLCDQVRACIAEIDAQGGVLAVIENGSICARIHEQALAAQARLDSGETQRVGESSCSPRPTPVISHVDGRVTREQQCQRLDQLRYTRDERAVVTALTALERGARTEGNNTLALCIEAMAARATVGECTAALERVWPRYTYTPSFKSGVYGPLRQPELEWQQLCLSVLSTAAALGRAPHVLLGKLGQDGHDRGIRFIAAALTDAGFAVTMLPMFQNPRELLAHAQKLEPVDVLGISSLAGAHEDWVTMLIKEINEHKLCWPVVVGGIVPARDVRILQAAGVAAFFGPGSDTCDIVSCLLNIIRSMALTCSTANHF